MKGLVFGLTFEDACVELDNIVERYKLYRYQIVQERRTKHEYSVTFDNGDNWRAVPASENRRGCKANVAYVDHRIDEEFIPMINACVAVGPWSAFNYF